jgi:lactoylglutathione lyase
MQQQSIGCVAVVVRDYEEAKAYYCGILGFDLIEDTELSENKRWVLVAPAGSRGTCLLLAKATNQDQLARVGDQTGGGVFLFLHTDDFWRDYQQMRQKGVNFREPPRQESYGSVAVFEDLYGNRWDLLELKRPGPDG